MSAPEGVQRAESVAFAMVRDYLDPDVNAAVTDDDIRAAASVFINVPNPLMVARRVTYEYRVREGQ